MALATTHVPALPIVQFLIAYSMHTCNTCSHTQWQNSEASKSSSVFSFHDCTIPSFVDGNSASYTTVTPSCNPEGNFPPLYYLCQASMYNYHNFHRWHPESLMLPNCMLSCRAHACNIWIEYCKIFGCFECGCARFTRKPTKPKLAFLRSNVCVCFGQQTWFEVVQDKSIRNVFTCFVCVHLFCVCDDNQEPYRLHFSTRWHNHL